VVTFLVELVLYLQNSGCNLCSVYFSIQEGLVQLEQQHKDMESTWRKKYGPLRKWITQSQARLNKEFAIAPDLDSVKKQRKDIEVS
jgi:hypothetical protein